MKKSLLFLASLVVSSVASAQWVKPVPSSTVDMDDSGSAEQYLYNKGAVGFFAGGNDWTTRASINATGDPIRMIKLYEDDEKTVPSGTWNFGCYPSVKGTWLYVSANAFDAQWVDAGNAVGNDSYPGTDMWVVKKQENGTYKFANWAIGETFLGVAEIYEGKKGNTRTYFYNPDAKYTYTENNEDFEAASFDGDFWDEWVFVTPEEREALVPQVELYMAAQSLNAAIENAKVENPTYNYSVIEAVYKNTSSTKEELQAAQTKLTAVLSLKKALDAAKEKYPELDFSSPESVYNNIDATTEALNAAESEVTVIVNNYFSSIASFDDPYDYTPVIGDGSDVGPWTFDGTGTWHTNTWSTEANNGGDGTDMTTPFCEYWIGSGGKLADAKIHQVLKGAAPGLYKFTVDVRLYNEAGTATALTGATLYFGDNTVTLDEQVEMYKSGNKCVLWNKNYFTIIAIVKEGGDIDFGFDIKDATFNWMAFKKTSLLYYGNKDVEANALKLYKAAYTFEKVDAEEYAANPAVIDAYNKAVDDFNAATTKEGILAAAAAADAAQTALNENVTAHANFNVKVGNWQSAYNEATDNGMAGDELNAFGEFIYNEDEVDGYPTPSVGLITSTVATKAEKYPFQSKAEVDEYIKKVDELWQEALSKSAVEGADMTGLLTNPDFGSSTAVLQEDGTYKQGTYNTNGWTGSAALGGLNELMCCEGPFGKVVDFYQVVKGAPAGLYKIETQAFVRPAGNGSYTGEEPINCWLRMNKFESRVPHILSDILPESEAIDGTNCYLTEAKGGTFWPNDTWRTGFDYKYTGVINLPEGEYTLPEKYDATSGGYVPNCMIGASTAFKAGRYRVSTYGLVNDGEDMEVGITTHGEAIEWFIFSGFKLTYMGKNPEAVNSVLEVKLQELRDCLDNEETVITGACRDACEKTYTEVSENTPDEKDALWAALNTVLDALNDAQANKDALAALTSVVGDMDNVAIDLGNIEGGADTDAYNKYADVVQPKTFEDAVDELNTAALKALTEEVKAMTEELKAALKDVESAPVKEAMATATDEAPVDCTALITNPSYEEFNSDGWSGSVKSHDNFNRKDMVEYYQGAFDHYQLLPNLPAGTYELSLNCFNRVPSTDAQADLDAFEEGKKAEKQTAFVYVQTADKGFSEPFRMISEGARETNDNISASCTELTSKKTSATLYTPNNMTTAGVCFEEVDAETGDPLADEKNYVVRVVFSLSEAGDVTIGAKNTSVDTWAIWDNWKLTYFGTESTKAVSDDPVAIDAINVQPASLKNRKVFENGRIVIYKNGQKYNVAGQAIK